MGLGEVLGVHQQPNGEHYYWVLLKMVDGNLIPTTYREPLLEAS